jgi:Uma2 family endonuclease
VVKLYGRHEEEGITMGDARSVAAERVRWTGADLELLPDNGARYEIVDGELLMSRQPTWEHQYICGNLYQELNLWSRESKLGRPNVVPGLVLSDTDNVIPDVVWISHERAAALVDIAGHLTGAPELVIEVLSPGETNVRRDREAKRKLYAMHGAEEYWIVDPVSQRVEIYRRGEADLRRVATFLREDTLTSPLLPGFVCPVARIFT